MVEQSTQAGRIETHFDLKTNRNVPACQVLCGLYGKGRRYPKMIDTGCRRPTLSFHAWWANAIFWLRIRSWSHTRIYHWGWCKWAIATLCGILWRPSPAISMSAKRFRWSSLFWYVTFTERGMTTLSWLVVHAFYNAKTNKAYRYKVRMMSLVTAKHLHALIKPCHYAYLFHFLIDHMNLDPDSAVILEMLQTFISDNSISLFKIERLLKAYLQGNRTLKSMDLLFNSLRPTFVLRGSRYNLTKAVASFRWRILHRRRWPFKTYPCCLWLCGS